jgi:hypothetical protein
MGSCTKWSAVAKEDRALIMGGKGERGLEIWDWSKPQEWNLE